MRRSSAEDAHRETAVLAPLGPADAVLRRFRADARRWTTATHVVLRGCDHRRSRARDALRTAPADHCQCRDVPESWTDGYSAKRA